MIVIVIGLPGTGKTTFSKALAQEIKGLHLNTDIIRDQLNLRGQYDRATKLLIYKTMMERAAAAIKKNMHVVLDGTFYKQQLRDDYLTFAEKHQVPLKWIELKATEAAVRERVETKRVYSEADYQVYLKVKKLFEPMCKDCLELWNEKATPIKPLINQALDYIGLKTTGENKETA
ncbi:MAG: AAA family ATPase [Bacteroidota bacterium]